MAAKIPICWEGKTPGYFGVYPEISLKQAREKREEAKQLLFDGIDPSEHKKTTKRMGDSDGFEAVAVVVK